MSLTKTVSQTFSSMLIIDGLTLLYNWHHWYRCCEIWDLSTLADKLKIVFIETSKLKIGDNFVFEKLIRTENYLLLTGHRICHCSSNEKNNGLTINDWWEKSWIHFFRRFCPVINLPRTNFDCVAFEDCPVWGKICKIVTNHPFFLSICDDRQTVFSLVQIGPSSVNASWLWRVGQGTQANQKWNILSKIINNDE